LIPFAKKKINAKEMKKRWLERKAGHLNLAFAPVKIGSRSIIVKKGI
jgi:hypothetical protein